MHAKCGSMEDAHWVFNMMPAQNMVSLNAVLGGCAMHGQSNEALKHFEQMCECLQSNDITSVCLCQLAAMQVWWMPACTVMLE